MRSDVGLPFALHEALRSHTKSNAVNIAGMRSPWNGSPPRPGRRCRARGSSACRRASPRTPERRTCRTSRRRGRRGRHRAPRAPSFEVVRDRGRAVVVGGRAELDSALVGRVERVVAVLQGFAVHGRRPAGAAVVDEEQIAVIHDRSEEVEVRVARTGGREARARPRSRRSCLPTSRWCRFAGGARTRR